MKRKFDDNGGVVVTDHETMTALGPSMLTVEDSRKILEPFSREQLLGIVQTALVRHLDVLEAVRSIADRDLTQRKLFIRGLGWETTTDNLRNIFSQYGEIEEAAVILDKATGKSKGYGFITFKHIDGAMQALKEPSKKIDGRMTVTQLAAAGISGGPGGGASNPLDVSMRKIYVANVPYDMSAERLLVHFSRYGEIEEGPLGFDKATGKSKGFALFVYKTAEAARASLVDPVKSIDGHQLNCKLAIDGKKGKPGTGDTGVNQGGREGNTGGPGGLAGHYGGSGASRISGYPGFSGLSQLGGNHFSSTAGGAAAVPGFSGIGSQAAGSNLGVPGGFSSGTGGPYSSGSHYGGHPASGYGGTGGTGAGLGATGRGLGGVGSGLSGSGGAGSGLAIGRGYGLPSSSGGMPVGDYPPTGHYGLSATGYQNQHHHSAGTSPAPRVPSGGVYQGVPPYY